MILPVQSKVMIARDSNVSLALILHIEKRLPRNDFDNASKGRAGSFRHALFVRKRFYSSMLAAELFEAGETFVKDVEGGAVAEADTLVVAECDAGDSGDLVTGK